MLLVSFSIALNAKDLAKTDDNSESSKKQLLNLVEYIDSEIIRNAEKSIKSVLQRNSNSSENDTPDDATLHASNSSKDSLKNEINKKMHYQLHIISNPLQCNSSRFRDSKRQRMQNEH